MRAFATACQASLVAIALEFIDFVVPIGVIHQKYPGGWQRCLKDHERLIGGRVWFDDHLFRDGAMNPRDIGRLVEEWQDLGFEPFVELDGRRVWKDVCVIESLFGGATLRCDWVAIDEVTGGAYMVGTQPGALIGREQMRGKGDGSGR